MHNGVSADGDGDGDGSPPALSSGSPAVCGTLILVPPLTLFSNELAIGSVGRGEDYALRCAAMRCDAAVLPGRGGRGSALDDGDGGAGSPCCGVAVLRRSRVVYRNMPAQNDKRLHSSGHARQGKARQGQRDAAFGQRGSTDAHGLVSGAGVQGVGADRIASIMRTDPPASLEERETLRGRAREGAQLAATAER